MRESILGGISEGYLQVRGLPHPIIQGEAFSPKPGYEIRPFAFMDGMKDVADGCEFTIKPNQGTRIQYITGEVRIQDDLKDGSGTFLALTPEGEVRRLPVYPHSTYTGVDYGKGWLVTWMARSKGAKVIQICRPPFQEEMEVEVQPGQTEVDGIQIPQTYWRERNSLLREASYGEQIENIEAKLMKGTQTDSRHQKNADPTPREVPLSLDKRGKLWMNLAILTIKAKYGHRAGVNDIRRVKEALEKYGDRDQLARTRATSTLFPPEHGYYEIAG